MIYSRWNICRSWLPRLRRICLWQAIIGSFALAIAACAQSERYQLLVSDRAQIPASLPAGVGIVRFDQPHGDTVRWYRDRGGQDAAEFPALFDFDTMILVPWTNGLSAATNAVSMLFTNEAGPARINLDKLRDDIEGTILNLKTNNVTTATLRANLLDLARSLKRAVRAMQANGITK